MLQKNLVTAALLVALAMAGCSTPNATNPTASPTPPAPAATTPPTQAATSRTNPDQVVGTVVLFSDGSNSVEVTIDEDNPAVRDFLSMLPLTLRLREFAGKEKIADLPRQLAHQGSPGSDPEDGDLIYFIPWGNLGFYYNTDGVGYSDQTIHLGTYNASADQLRRLEGHDVTVSLVD